MTKNSNQDFRVADPASKKIVTIRKINVAEFNEILSELNLLITDNTSLTLSAYHLFLVKKLVTNWRKLYKTIEEENKIEFTSILYEYIVSIYPRFSVALVCKIINLSIVNQLMKEQQAENIVNVEASPEIELSSLTDVNRIESSLKENLIGQEEVIKNIVSTLKLMATGLSTHTSFYFAGQPGCGKSHCAKILGKQLKNFYQINCGEYSNGGEYTKLIGSPPGYIGHTENTVLGQKAAISNRWVLLFDEFEKANEKFQEFLLNLLDEGKVTDNLGQTLDFSKSVFIFTSNQGLKDTVGVKKIGLGEKISTYVSSKESILEDIKKHLSPEFLDRIDNMVFFNPLTKDNIEKIIKLELNNYPIISSKKLTDFIINNAYTPEEGARHIKKFIKKSLIPMIADQLLEVNNVEERKNLRFNSYFRNGDLRFKKVLCSSVSSMPL